MDKNDENNNETLTGGSDWEFNNFVVLIGFDEVVNEVSVEDGLYDSCQERCPDNVLPMEDPK